MDFFLPSSTFYPSPSLPPSLPPIPPPPPPLSSSFTAASSFHFSVSCYDCAHDGGGREADQNRYSHTVWPAPAPAPTSQSRKRKEQCFFFLSSFLLPLRSAQLHPHHHHWDTEASLFDPPSFLVPTSLPPQPHRTQTVSPQHRRERRALRCGWVSRGWGVGCARTTRRLTHKGVLLPIPCVCSTM